MINNCNEFTRRILNFPAVRPCESVSFSSLLNSLITLGHTICGFKSATFFTNKKNARDSIRLIETLVVFLEEIRNGFSAFDDSMLLSFSELHFTFQKVHFLLQDCVRDDARLWMLSQSEKVASHFRVLVRAIGVALDVLPTMESDEVQELVDFVRKQVLKMRFEVEKDDDQAWRTVLRVFDQFENGIAPELVDLRMVVEYLSIGTWYECNKEARFLESEISISSDGKKDVAFLSSLMAFMVYCRCTVCENDSATSGKFQGWSHEVVIMGLNPDDFRCPISLEIMTDPVTLSTGHTYERSSIEKWFRSGNHTCPTTGKRLVSIDLVPNVAVKQLIKQYCHENGIPFPESGGQSREMRKWSAGAAGSIVAEQAMILLANFLVGRLVAGANEERCKAAFEIRLLTKTSVFNRSCLVEADAIQPLLGMVCLNNPVAQEHTMAAILNLSKCAKSKRIIIESGGLELILDVLNNGLKIEARQHAAGTLFYLASVEEYRRKIGRIPGAISGLLGLIQNGPDRAKKNALVSILGLLLFPENHWPILSSGLVLLVVDLLRSSENDEIITDSLAVLASLAEKLDGAMAIVSAGALPVIIEVLCSSGSRAANEYCVSLLLALCMNDGADVVPVLVRNPSLMVVLYSLLTEGTTRSRKKASSIIRILHAYNEKSSSGLMGRPQEHFVPVW